MKSFGVLQLPTSLLSIWVASAKAQLPYNPTRILQNDTRLYVFRPSSTSQFELGSIDLTSKVQSSDLPYTTLYPSLPFLGVDSARAFTPLLDDGGNITVYAGDCGSGATGAELWTFTADLSDKQGNGSWKQEQVSYQGSEATEALAGTNFLNAGVSFSSLVGGDASDTGAYVFGGMCPLQSASQGDWMASANYSNMMVTITPESSSADAVNYQIGISASRGPPIPEAGFTMTGLTPSYSNKSDGSQTQQQDFVLIGGHTSSAFINMSQVALFSLPQQSWTFLPIQQPNTERTDLTIRTDVTEIEPRSGHTAVLTSDGRSIVLFGGWIGDTNTPADPQFAILNVAEGYGGQGSWEWMVPTTSGSSLSTGAGLYGHGAVMLPGNVMMILGGYTIAASNSRHRRATPTASTQTFFFNVTSTSWISNYSLPPKSATSSEAAESGPLSKTSQKAGLGVGLFVGCAAVIGLSLFYFWYTRRTKKQRETRENQLRELAISAHRYNIDGLSPGIDGRGGNLEAVDYYDDGHDQFGFPHGDQQTHQGWRRINGHDAERTGLLVEIPSPTRGLRRSLGGRGSYHPAPRYDEKRVHGSGNIHPIDELEEDENNQEEDNPSYTVGNEMSERPQRVSAFTNAPILDPFTDSSRYSERLAAGRTPMTQSEPSSPVHERAIDNEPGLVSGVLLPRRSSPSNSGGRTSPTKSERTRSDLSDRSTRSNLSSKSGGQGALGRNLSMRSPGTLSNNPNPFITPEVSPTTDRSPHRMSSGWASQTQTEPRTRSFASTRSTRSNRTVNAIGDGDSFTTARTSFMQLQAEGEALLGGPPLKEKERPGTSSSSSNTHSSNTHSYAVSETAEAVTVSSGTATVISTEKPASRPRRKSWLGSVRRALNRASTVTSTDRTRSMIGSIPQYEPEWGPKTRTTDIISSDCRSFPASSPPRRTVSDASFWKSKRGKQDWLDDEANSSDPKTKWRRNSGDDWGAPEDRAEKEKEQQNEDEDWDVEAAVQRRAVQFMFTVPKQRLRVVNADVDGGSLISLDKDEKDKEREKDAKKEEKATRPSNVIPTKHATPGKLTIPKNDGIFQNDDSPPGSSGASPASKKSVRDLVCMYETETSPKGKEKASGK